MNMREAMESPISTGSDLSFAELRKANVDRVSGFGHTLKEWPPERWALAMAGEVGEACNKIKKRIRGDDVSIEQILDEIADVIIYGDLLAASMDGDLGEAVRKKFNAVSDRRGLPQRL